MAKINTTWIKHTKTPDEKAKLIDLINNNTFLFGLVSNILSEKIEDLNKQSQSITDFSDGNWAFKQAFRNGRLSALKEIRELFTKVDHDRNII